MYSVLVANILLTVTTQLRVKGTKVKVKINFTLEHATEAQRGSRCIPLLFL